MSRFGEKMEYKVITLNCPGCGAPVTLETKKCKYCDREIIIEKYKDLNAMSPLEINKRNFSYKKSLEEYPDSKELNTSAAFCLLKLKNYDLAINCFEKAMIGNFEDSDIYFYAAVCLLRGKKAFLTPRVVIDKIEEYINSAIMIDPKGLYYYFWAYIRYDHHYRKSYRMSPDFGQLLSLAKENCVTYSEISELYSLLGVERPNCL